MSYKNTTSDTTISRPTPEAFLKIARQEERGHLRIFLGAAPGVGKTSAMLRAAHERAAEGENIVIGVIESHGRTETEQLCHGLDRISLVTREHREHQFQEFDLDATLEHAPAIVLVDELAHRNIPGGRHPRRYQDIEELLDIGIDVWTTLNVQHIESLNDAVARITNIRMRETIPDSLITRARDITLIDLTPEELIQRLKQGKVYIPEQARAALDGFFNIANLTALRELAMQTMAERIENDVRDSMGIHGVPGPWPVRPKILVALRGSTDDATLIRATHRMAERGNATWQAVYVDIGNADSSERSELEKSSQLIERLGGEITVLSGESRVGELLDYARRLNVTTLMVSRSENSFWCNWQRSLSKQLLRKAHEFDLIVIAETERYKPLHRMKRSLARLSIREWLLPICILPITLGLSLLIDHMMALANLSLIFLTGVLVTAVYSGTRSAMLSALLSFLVYNFFFTEPRYTLAMSHRDQFITVFFFLVVALIGGQLAGRARRQLVALRESRDQTQRLLQFSRALAVAADHASVRTIGMSTLADWLQVPTVYLELSPEDEAPQVTESYPGLITLDNTAKQAAAWSYHQRRRSGHGSHTLAIQRWRFIPLVEGDTTLGVVGLALGDREAPLDHSQEILTDTLINQLSMALGRTRLVNDLGTAKLAEENERLRSALLSSVSHDLRTPLASIIGSASSLRDLDDQLSQDDKRELLDGVLSESERLNRYIQNLLDMTRLGHGSLKIERDWVSLSDLINAALNRLGSALSDIRVERDWADNLPLLYVHPALIEQALVNVIENAVRFSPYDGRIHINAARQHDDMIIRITDEGPGIPEYLREQVFDMFFTGGEGDRGKHGSGLGLAICRGMIGAHGGSIDAEANSGDTGTRIVIRLPLIDSEGIKQKTEGEHGR